MTQKVVVQSPPKSRYEFCELLEKGNILAFPKSLFDGGREGLEPKILNWLNVLFPPYEGRIHSIDSSKAPLVKAIQMDAFAKHPTHGARILRFFINLGALPCQWTTASRFGDLVEKVPIEIPPTTGYDLKSRLARKAKLWLHSTGFRMQLRSPYDVYMLKLQKYLRSNLPFQQTCDRKIWEFESGMCWAALTDQLAYGPILGENVLVFTYWIPQKALLCPEASPVCILERLSGKNLIDPQFSQPLLCEKVAQKI